MTELTTRPKASTETICTDESHHKLSSHWFLIKTVTKYFLLPIEESANNVTVTLLNRTCLGGDKLPPQTLKRLIPATASSAYIKFSLILLVNCLDYN